MLGKTDKPKEVLFEAQRMCPANTQFTHSTPALEYLARVCKARRWLKLSFARFDPDDVVKRVLARDVVWLANFVAVWLDEHLLSAQVRRSLRDSPGTMCQPLNVLIIAMDLGHIIDFGDHSVNIAFNYCNTAILEGCFGTLANFAKQIVREYHKCVPGYRADGCIGISQSLGTMLLSMQHHGVLKQLMAQGLILEAAPQKPGDWDFPPDSSTTSNKLDDEALELRQSCLRSQLAKQLVNAIVPLFNSKKPHDLEKAKALLRRLPGDVVRRFVITHIPMFRADIYSMLYYDMRVVGTEAYLDVLLACRTRRNTISSMHCPFHDRQRRFQVAPYGSSSVDRDVVPLPVEFVPREHSTVDHTHLHMYADVNPRWTCKDA
eukprot:PhM_4_TR15956/c0_g2_i1/m.102866